MMHVSTMSWPETVTRRVKRFIVLQVLLSLYAIVSTGAAPGETRIRHIRQQIESTEDVLAGITNETEYAEWQQRLTVLNQDLDNLLRRISLEKREKRLVSRKGRNSLHALQEALGAIDSDIETPGKLAAKSRKTILELRTQRANIEKRRRFLETNAERNAEAIAEYDQQSRNLDEEILLFSLKRDAAENRNHLTEEANRIGEFVRLLPINPRPTIRIILENRRHVTAAEKDKKDMAKQIDALGEQRDETTAALSLAEAKFAQIDNEIEVLQQKKLLSKSSQIKKLLYTAISEKKSLQKRIAVQQDQVSAIDKSCDLAVQLHGLYEKEIYVLREYLSALLRRYWLSILVPVSVIVTIVVLYLIINHLMLPRMCKRDKLFIARRLSGYIAFLVVILVLAGFFLEDLKAIATILGIAGAALVIALQDLCSSLAGWFVIIASRKVNVGDRIEVTGHCGDVIDIQLLRTTMLELHNWLEVDEPTGRIVIIPNSFIFKEKVFNYSHVHPFIWNKIDVTVTFETSAQETRGLLTEILEEETREEFDAARNAPVDMERKYGLPATTYQPKIHSVIADSGVLFSLLYISHYRRRIAVRNRINKRIIAEFERNPRINFAYPTERHVPTPESGSLHVTVDETRNHEQ